MSKKIHSILMRNLIAIFGVVILCNCSYGSEKQPKDIGELVKYAQSLHNALIEEKLMDNINAMLDPMLNELKDNFNKSEEKQTFQQIMYGNVLPFALTYYTEFYAVEKRGLRKEYIAFLKSDLYLDYIRKNCPKGYKASIKEINTNRIQLMKRFNPKLGLVRRSPEYFEAINIIFGKKVVDIPQESGVSTDSEVYQRFE